MITSRIEETKDRFAYHQSEWRLLNERLDELKVRLENLSGERKLLSKADSAFEELVKRLNNNSISMVEKLVSKGLTVIFQHPFEFKVKMTTKRGNLNYDLYLLDDGKETDIMNSYGGGIVCIISILMRIVTIMVLGLKRILILDESLAQLSKDYTSNAAQLLRNLGRDFGFTILMVTHDQGFVEHADKVFVVSKEGKYSKFKEVSNVQTNNT